MRGNPTNLLDPLGLDYRCWITIRTTYNAKGDVVGATVVDWFCWDIGDVSGEKASAGDASRNKAGDPRNPPKITPQYLQCARSANADYLNTLKAIDASWKANDLLPDSTAWLLNGIYTGVTVALVTKNPWATGSAFVVSAGGTLFENAGRTASRINQERQRAYWKREAAYSACQSHLQR